jgi:hypothetical protein
MADPSSSFVRSTPSRRRRGFGLDTPLPANPAIVEAQILRLLSAADPQVLALRPSSRPDRAPAPGHRAAPTFVAGVPDLLLLLPAGRSACLKIRTQAERLSRDETAFRDLCRQRGIPFAVVRSVEEAKVALRGFGLSVKEN